MIDIECRTVKTRFTPKQTGLDVECSLENGLICKSGTKGKTCQDFEIRVLCQCGRNTKFVPKLHILFFIIDFQKKLPQLVSHHVILLNLIKNTQLTAIFSTTVRIVQVVQNTLKKLVDLACTITL